MGIKGRAAGGRVSSFHRFIVSSFHAPPCLKPSPRSGCAPPQGRTACRCPPPSGTWLVISRLNARQRGRLDQPGGGGLDEHDLLISDVLLFENPAELAKE